jgi:hypothetical protein
MTADEAMQRLAALATEIERHQTAIWLAEQEREEVRTELRRALHASSGQPPEPATYAAIQPQIGAGPHPAPAGPPPRRTVY